MKRQQKVEVCCFVRTCGSIYMKLFLSGSEVNSILRYFIKVKDYWRPLEFFQYSSFNFYSKLWEESFKYTFSIPLLHSSFFILNWMAWPILNLKILIWIFQSFKKCDGKIVYIVRYSFFHENMNTTQHKTQKVIRLLKNYDKYWAVHLQCQNKLDLLFFEIHALMILSWYTDQADLQRWFSKCLSIQSQWNIT